MSAGAGSGDDAREAAPPGHRVVVTAGHVDHGKSTLLRTLTGMEPDRLEEEQRRGLTTDLGFVWTSLGPGTAPLIVAFVDVPGHERFVGTMLAGAGAAPTALLVVAADDGWSAQSQEHLEILDLLDVPAAAVVVTKTSLVDADRVAQVTVDVTERLAGTSLAGAPAVAVDAVDGTGLDALRDALHGSLAAATAPPDLERPRLWVDRSFTVAGAGTVVTGTLREGRLRRGDEVEVLPRGLRTRVRGLQALGRDVEEAGPGMRVACNLAGVDHHLVDRGHAVVGAGPWRVTREADLLVRVLPGRRVERRGAWHVHVGSARTTAQVLPLTGAVEDRGVVRVRLAWPLPLVVGDRVVLREAGRRATVAGGVVVDAAPGPRPRGRAARATQARALEDVASAEPPARASAVLRAAMAAGGSGARDADALLASVGHPRSAGPPPGTLRVGDTIAHAQAARAWAGAVLQALDAARGPAGAGGPRRAAPVPREALETAARAAGAPVGAAGSVADLLVARGRLRRVGGGYVRPDDADAAADAGRRRRERVVARLAAEPFAPPDLDEVAREEGLDHREVAALVQSGVVVRCGKVAFAADAVREAVVRLESLAGVGGAFTAAEARQALGTSRRFAIPLLEHLAARGITRFDGQRHTLLGP